MKPRLLFILLIPLFFCPIVTAQQIRRADMVPLFRHLAAQSWDSVYASATRIATRFPDDTSDFRYMANYSMVLAAAAKVADKKITHLKSRELVWPAMGKKLLMPVHTATTDTMNIGDNITHLKNKDSITYAETVVRLKKGGTVLTFENFKFSPELDITSLGGKSLRCGGTLKQVELNHWQDEFWVMQLFLEDSWMVVQETTAQVSPEKTTKPKKATR